MVNFTVVVSDSVSVTLFNLIHVGMVDNGQSSANPKCGDTYTYEFPTGEGRSFFCHPSLKGRYVIIRFVDEDKPLTLCEVEVYSERRGMMRVIYCHSKWCRACLWCILYKYM